jgi:TIGR00255 family protein
MRSMTAFERREQQGDWGALTWELRSVNHRYLDVTVRLPEQFRALEGAVRKRVAAFAKRGKVECLLHYEALAESAAEIVLNKAVASRLLEICGEIEAMLNRPSTLSVTDLLCWPSIIKETERSLEGVCGAALELLDETLIGMVATRCREGEHIRELIEVRCHALKGLVAAVRGRRPEILAHQRQKIRSRLNELAVEADPTRLEQELALLAQRFDIAEELERLDAHSAEVTRVLNHNESVGRRLDFLMQELNREANTLASKSSDIETTSVTVEMKVLIEQMREHVQNIE